MVCTQLMGGLGNLIFQMSAAISIADQNSDKAVFNIHTAGNQHWKSLIRYKDNIFHKINFVDSYSYDKVYEEKIPAEKIIINYENNLLLKGYFIDKYYFKGKEDLIYNTFFTNNYILNEIKEKYKNIDFENSTSIHVRRGDYVPLSPDYHLLCSIEYYEKSINIANTKNYIIFSNDIQWCKKNFIGNFIFIENEKDYIEMYMMSMCKNNIIANSTFSWWGAWANKNSNAKIIAPELWLGKKLIHLDIGKDKYLDNWIVL